MKKQYKPLLPAALALTLMLQPAVPAFAKSFPDVNSSDWYADVVDEISDLGYMNGYGDSNDFGPQNTITRAEMAVVFANMDSYKAVQKYDTTGLADLVEGNQWYTGACNWAYKNGYIQGYDIPGPDLFGPNDGVTREQLAVMLARYANTKGVDTGANIAVINRFPDGNTVSEWAEDAMAWAIENKLIEGEVRTNGTVWINPNREVLRAEAAKMILATNEAIDKAINGEDDNEQYYDMNLEGFSEGNAIMVDTNFYNPDKIKSVEYTFQLDNKVYGSDDIIDLDTLTKSGGTVYVPYDGNWVVTATVTATDGKIFNDQTIVSVHTDQSWVKLHLPSEIAADEKYEFDLEMFNIANVEWSVRINGEYVPANLAFEQLSNTRGRITPLQSGNWTITADTTDIYNKTKTYNFQVYVGKSYMTDLILDEPATIDSRTTTNRIDWHINNYDKISSVKYEYLLNDTIVIPEAYAWEFRESNSGGYIVTETPGKWTIRATITGLDGSTSIQEVTEQINYDDPDLDFVKDTVTCYNGGLNTVLMTKDFIEAQNTDTMTIKSIEVVDTETGLSVSNSTRNAIDTVLRSSMSNDSLIQTMASVTDVTEAKATITTQTQTPMGVVESSESIIFEFLPASEFTLSADNLTCKDGMATTKLNALVRQGCNISDITIKRNNLELSEDEVSAIIGGESLVAGKLSPVSNTLTFTNVGTYQIIIETGLDEMTQQSMGTQTLTVTVS